MLIAWPASIGYAGSSSFPQLVSVHKSQCTRVASSVQLYLVIRFCWRVGSGRCDLKPLGAIAIGPPDTAAPVRLWRLCVSKAVRPNQNHSLGGPLKSTWPFQQLELKPAIRLIGLASTLNDEPLCHATRKLDGMHPGAGRYASTVPPQTLFRAGCLSCAGQAGLLGCWVAVDGEVYMQPAAGGAVLSCHICALASAWFQLQSWAVARWRDAQCPVGRLGHVAPRAGKTVCRQNLISSRAAKWAVF